MLKQIPGLVLSASIAFAGVAQAQTVTPLVPAAPTAPTIGGTPTTRPSMPMPSMAMPMMPGPMAERVGTSSMTTGEIVTIGVGVVAGVVLFQSAMWHGMTIVGAVVGGYVGEYLYNTHTAPKTGA